jgi:ATP-binding cassette subfamily B protein
VLDTKSDITDGEVSARLTGDIEFDDVTFVYPLGTKALDGMSFRVSRGETVAIVGRTGSGKSTIARLLARFYDTTSGEVRIDGRDVRDYQLAELRDQVGIVPDEPFLFSVSIRDNIAYGRPEAPMEEVVRAAAAAGAAGFIEELSSGYSTVVGERGYTLSGGQRQRIAIARALLVNPPVLVLDDATSAIDVKVEHGIHKSLQGLLSGRTTLIVAHRLATIALADRVLLAENGKIIADGTHNELLATEPRYAAVLAEMDDEEEPAGLEVSA